MLQDCISLMFDNDKSRGSVGSCKAHVVQGRSMRTLSECPWQAVRSVMGLLFLTGFMCGGYPARAAGEEHGNLLLHSSFEVPGNNHWGFQGSKLSETDIRPDAAHGSYSLQWPYLNPFLQWPYSDLHAFFQM